MNSSRLMIIIASITLILVLFIPAGYKVHNDHINKLYTSATLKIVQNAKKCELEKKCNNKKIFLKDLYDYKYIDKIVNPKTKEYFNENSYVVKKNNKYVFIENE